MTVTMTSSTAMPSAKTLLTTAEAVALGLCVVGGLTCFVVAVIIVGRRCFDGWIRKEYSSLDDELFPSGLLAK